jgi:hypothetical protein
MESDAAPDAGSTGEISLVSQQQSPSVWLRVRR